jgi:hypothetical protein
LDSYYPRIFWHAFFLEAGLGVMDQFCVFHAHPILCRLISSCGYTLRILFTKPL